MKISINSSQSITEEAKKLKPGDELYLEEGIYNEKVVILTPNIKIYSSNPLNTIIRNHDFFHKIMSDYNECNTFRTYTVYIGANNVTLENITIENTSIPAAKYGQAVALHVDSNNFLCKNVILKSEQDTLFTGPLPPDLINRHQGFLEKSLLKATPAYQKYENCKIYGNVDFIFGTATALFEGCELISLENGKNPFETSGYLCAPAHNKETEYGYLFYKCNLTKLGNPKNVFLARPWRDYGTAAFIDCKIGDHINPLGFNKWNKTNRDKTARFFEYSTNTDLSKREAWANELTEVEAKEYYNNFIEYSKKISALS